MTPDPSTLSHEEIARAVAVEVMGWRLGTEDDGWQYWATGSNALPVDAWCPHKNMTDAWEVVEKMKERGVYLDIISVDDGWMVGDGGRGYADDDGRVDIELESHATAPTAPLAICLASLRAVRGNRVP